MKNIEDRPLGPEGPKVTTSPKAETPKNSSELSHYGLKILRIVARGKDYFFSEYRVCEIMGAHSDWHSCQSAIDALVEKGYLEKNESGHLVVTRKGKRELK